MKLRIKGNSIRIRLSRTEVDTLAKDNYLEERTEFANTAFIYALQAKAGISGLEAGFSENKLTMYVSTELVTEWPTNNTVGFDNKWDAGNKKSLFLLLEKDFKCIDNAMEDQTDNYENPNKTC